MNRYSLFAVFAVFALVLTSCSGSRQQQESGIAVFNLDDLLDVVEDKVDATVTVVGFVTHTCRHAGKKAFIVGEAKGTTFRIEAEGNIGGFTPDLVGSKLAITGIIKEEQLSEEFINEFENTVRLRQEDGELCEAEVSNIEEWRNWMKERNKNYYAVYFMEGLEYELLN
jgi:hypothetical protein